MSEYRAAIDGCLNCTLHGDACDKPECPANLWQRRKRQVENWLRIHVKEVIDHAEKEICMELTE